MDTTNTSSARAQSGTAPVHGHGGSPVISRFGKLVDETATRDPERACRLLVAGFRAQTLRTRLLPNRSLAPSAQLATLITTQSVTEALARPADCVVTSIFMPSEVFLAMGLRPLVAEAIGDFLSGAQAEQGFIDKAEQLAVPESYCSYHKTLIGAVQAGVIAAPALIANSSVACDANNLTFRWLATRQGCRHVYVDVPYEPSEDAVAYVADQLAELAEVAQEAYRRTLDPQALKTCVARSRETLETMERALVAAGRRPRRTTMVAEMMRTCAVHMSLGTRGVLDMARMMEAEAKGLSSADGGGQADAAPQGGDFTGLNLAWVHTMPYFSASVGEAVDLSDRAQICAAEMVFDQARPGGWQHGSDEPYLAMAERMVYDSYNGPVRRRIARVLELARAAQADGVVVFDHWGCKETAGASQLMRGAFEEAGFPTLVLDGDGCARRNMPESQAATRIQAYLETLEARRQTR